MVWSKRKPYYGLKLSVNEFFRAPVRYLREYITKESILEKPYLDDDRGEMHQGPPRNPDPNPPGDPGDYPPWNPTGPGGDLPPPPFPGFNPRPDPHPPIPGVYPYPGGPTGEMWIQPLCTTSSDLSCLNVGETALIYAASNEKDLKTSWGIEVTDPEVVSVKVIKKFWDKIVIQVTALKEQEDLSPTITIWGSWAGGYTSRCGWYYVTVPCCNDSFPIEWDTEISEETIPPEGDAVVAVTKGTGPYSWSVTGVGFSIEPKTDSRFNLLLADETSCGMATIVVEDACGSATTGEVRSTAGEWAPTGIDTCIIPGTYDSIAAGYHYRTKGKYRMKVKLVQLRSCAPACASGGNCGSMCNPPANCNSICSACGSGSPCTECITNSGIGEGYDYKNFPCFLKTSCGDGNYSIQQCWCNDEIIVEEWVC